VSDAPDLDLSADVLALTRALVDAPSESGDEKSLADAVEAALRALGGLEVERVGDTVLARTNLDLPTRVVLAGHLDTVPIADNVPSDLREVDGVQRLYGCGTSDMKSGDAVMLRLAGRFGVAGAPAPAHDLTFVFYDNEEVEHAKNGLGRVARERAEYRERPEPSYLTYGPRTRREFLRYSRRELARTASRVRSSRKAGAS